MDGIYEGHCLPSTQGVHRRIIALGVHHFHWHTGVPEAYVSERRTSLNVGLALIADFQRRDQYWGGS